MVAMMAGCLVGPMVELTVDLWGFEMVERLVEVLVAQWAGNLEG